MFQESETLDIRENFVTGRTVGSPESWQIQQSFGSWIAVAWGM